MDNGHHCTSGFCHRAMNLGLAQKDWEAGWLCHSPAGQLGIQLPDLSVP